MTGPPTPGGLARLSGEASPTLKDLGIAAARRRSESLRADLSTVDASRFVLVRENTGLVPPSDQLRHEPDHAKANGPDEEPKDERPDL